VLPLLSCDAAELFLAVAEGRLDRVPAPTFSSDSAVCVVLASPGYPDHPSVGDPIGGLDEAGQSVAAGAGVAGAGVAGAGATVFHAGTSRPGGSGPFRTAGGRVLGVTAVAPSLAAARAGAYAALAPIEWDGLLMRSDIAALAAARPAPNGAARPAHSTKEKVG
jgi:phosphoribosylamine--glycine ligase